MKAIAEELTKAIDQMGRLLGVMRLAHESNEDYLIRMKKETAIGLKVPIKRSSSETERTSIGLKSEDRTNPILEAIKSL